MIPLTTQEVRRLLITIVWPHLSNSERAIAWSAWRRRHQAIARRCHYRARPPNH